MASTSNQTESSTRSFFECEICCEDFDLAPRRPVIGTCGHTVCSSCRVLLPKMCCPYCQKVKAFEIEVTNFSLMGIIERKLNREKKPKASSVSTVCSHCFRSVEDVDCQVCLTCVQKKSYPSLQNLCDEINSKRMCSNCTTAIQVHDDGHETHGLNEAKDSLISMQLLSSVERCANITLPLLGEFHTASEIANETYKDLYKAVSRNGRMAGVESLFPSLLETIRKELAPLHSILIDNTRNLWKFTHSSLNAMESMVKERELFQGRNFTPAEDQTFRALRTTFRNRIFDLKAQKKKEMTIDDWRKMTLDEKKAKALGNTADK